MTSKFMSPKDENAIDPSTPAHADDRLMREDEVARHLDIAPKTLRKWRVAGSPLPYVKLGRRLVRYRRSDVLAFVESKAITSTSAATATNKGGNHA